MSSDAERLAAKLKLNAADYSYIQLVQIENEDAWDRAQRIAVIDKDNAAFRARVADEVARSGAAFVTTLATSGN